MQLLRLRNSDQDEFAASGEVAMDLHLARSQSEEFYLVIGSRVGIALNQSTFLNPDESFFAEALLDRGRPLQEQERTQVFDNWLRGLDEAPNLSVATPAQAWRSFINAFGPVIPNVPLPPPPARPSSIYGHLPFFATTFSETIIYRWEAFPTSRRIDRTKNPPTIATDTYAAPASELTFAPTGFAAVARFALPNLLPACFRWELQPIAGTKLECGASVPLYGQSGGGVEVRFTSLTQNRGPIANPVVLPAL